MPDKNKKNTVGSNKSGRFDIPINPDQAADQADQSPQSDTPHSDAPHSDNSVNTINKIDTVNSTASPNNVPTNNLSQNRFGIETPVPPNNQLPKNRGERFNGTHTNYTVNSTVPAISGTPAGSKFDIKQSEHKETQTKNIGGKFALDNSNSPNNTSENYQSQIIGDGNNLSMQTMHTIQPKQSSTPTETMKPSSISIKKYLLPIDAPFERLRLGFLLFVILPLTVYSYYMALEQIVYDWINNVDYSHGFFVIPLTAIFLYSRLDSYPGTRYRLCWIALIPIILCITIRSIASWYYMEALEEWSLFLWVIGIVWFFYGTRVFLWALPSLCFLLFMFQLPYSIDVIMKHNLQLYAARFAAVLLQILGEPAIAINNIIRVKGEILNVEAACSGIRFLISVFAIATAAVLFMRKPWWQNLIVMLIAAPLAMFINASRITMTGILLLHHRNFLAQFVPKERVNVFADEIAGYTMIIVVAVIFMLFLFFMDKVFKRVNI
ncbi:MAG: exosortase/archaeosortase family protein [Planctomycetaceae bacterium]|jgi:exosortase|nr:exosortase/archaeosortase family protein [Planctomycetaceae bacterium]